MNFKKLLGAFAAIGTSIAVVAAFVIPSLSFAADYVVSPTYIGTSTLSTYQANQICGSLSDSMAAQTSFCTYNTANGVVPPSVVGIADSAIMIDVTSSTSATITWTTSVPTTSSIWYSSDPTNTSLPAVMTNTNDGYTMYHTVYLTGIDLVAQHLFQVGGTAQGNSQVIMSNWQWL